MRGCRRGCSPADKTVFEAVTDMSARVVCCFGLNRSSAAWRALLFPPRSSPAFGICELPDKSCSRKQWLKSSRDVRRLGELCKARTECATDLLDRLRTSDRKICRWRPSRGRQCTERPACAEGIPPATPLSLGLWPRDRLG